MIDLEKKLEIKEKLNTKLEKNQILRETKISDLLDENAILKKKKMKLKNILKHKEDQIEKIKKKDEKNNDPHYLL